MRPVPFLLLLASATLLLQAAEARVTGGGRTSRRDDDDDDDKPPPPLPYPPGLAPSPPPPVDNTPAIITLSIIGGIFLLCALGCACYITGGGERAVRAVRNAIPFKASVDMPLLAMDTPVRL